MNPCLVWYREWCETPYQRAGKMIPVSLVPKITRLHTDPGYCSVFLFNESDAREIKARKSSVGLQHYAVGADRVTLDLDDGVESLRIAEDVLQQRSLAYSVYVSGGKGFHVEIPTPFLYGYNIPYSHWKFVEGLGVPCDKTLYQHGRLLSLPGRIHPKTKVRKHFLKSVPGEEANVELVDVPVFTFTERGETISDLQSALLRAVDLGVEPEVGNRHISLWGASMDLVRAGLADASIFDILANTMRSWEHPKSSEDLIKIIRRAREQA